MDSCILETKTHDSIVKQIAKQVGSNEQLRGAIYALIIGDGNKLSQDFIDDVEKNYSANESKIDWENINDNKQAPKIAKHAIRYFRSKYPSISDFSKQSGLDDNVKTYGYSSTIAREEGKGHLAVMLLQAFNDSQNNGEEVPEDAFNYFKTKAKERYRNFVLNKIAEIKGKSLQAIVQEFNDQEDKDKWVISSLGKPGTSITIDNIIALYKEFNSPDKSDEFFKEILADTRVGDVYALLKNEIKDEAEALAEDEDKNDNKTDTGQVSITAEDLNMDESIRNFNNHIGIYTSFMSHIGGRIKNYFNTLRVLKSPVLDDYDIANFFGIPKTMDANACASIIYNRGVFTNISTMIDSIKDIAQTVPGFECFIQLADDLRNNLDFATEFIRVFSKTKMTRIETVIENNTPKTHQTNQRAQAQSAMLFDMMNDLLHTTINTDDSYYDRKLNGIKELVDKAKKAESKEEQTAIVNKIAKILTDSIRAYLPSVQEKAIINYIKLNNFAEHIDEIASNIYDLLPVARALVRESPKAKNRKASNEAEIEKIKEENDRAYAQGLWLTYEEAHRADDYKNDNYAAGFNDTIIDLSKKLLPYSVINTQFNSRNIYGNNTSDIINTSWITRLSDLLQTYTTKEEINGKTVKRNRALERWGRDKLRSKQYKYSNILLEQVEPNTGTILHPGLFKYVYNANSEPILVLTDYAEGLLQCALVNGSGNRDNSKNVSYADMTRTDFIPTSYLQYFNTEEPVGGSKFDLATYFLRTPSDASNAFAIRMPRFLNLTGRRSEIEDFNFVQLENEQEVNDYATNLATEKVKVLNFDDYVNENVDRPVNSLSPIKGNFLDKHILPQGNLIINNIQAIKYTDDTKKHGTVMFVDGNSGSIIVLEGDIAPMGSTVGLKHAKFLGVVNKHIVRQQNDSGEEITLKDKEVGVDKAIQVYKYHYLDEIKKGNIKGAPVPKYRIDRKNRVFEMIKNQFKQEMLNAAVAIDHYFVTTPDKAGGWVVKVNKGKPIFKGDKDAGKQAYDPNISNTKGYNFYHLGKNGQVYKEIKDAGGKTIRVLDGGAVFGSSKFTLKEEYTDKNGNVTIRKKNYFDDIISNGGLEDASNPEVINFLYGRSMRIVKEPRENNDYEVTDVIFDKELDDKINERIEQFILDNIEETRKTLTQYEDFLDSYPLNDSNIIEFATNQFLTFCIYDELFEGDTKFYKDTQTVLKRAKEYQASGVPYGITNLDFEHVDNLSPFIGSFMNDGSITEPIFETVTDEKGKEVRRRKLDENGEPAFSTTKIQDIFNNTIFEGTQQRNGFVGVTIKNTIGYRKTVLEDLKTTLMEKASLSESEAMDLLYGPIQYKKDGVTPERDKDGNIKRKGGFTDSKVNDAQSYITVQEWARRIAGRGQLGRYLPLIRKLTNPDAVLTAKELKEFVQVQKNIYYDLYYDERYGIEVPRQIKNAEFVLVPQLIKGTQLEAVYNLMRKCGVDQLNTVETSKASNEELLTLWDNEGNLSENAIKEFENKVGVIDPKNPNELPKPNSVAQIYSYNNLYTQQETPQHMNAENKAGIQIVKKIMDNLPANDSRKQMFFKLFGANIRESFENTLKKFEIPINPDGTIDLDENGHIKDINMKVFFDRLKEEMMRTGIDSNLLDYVTIEKGSTQANMPASMNNVITKFEQIVQSMFNNAITRQKLPGFHAPQVTNVGWKNMANDLPNYTREYLENSRLFKEFSANTPDAEIKWNRVKAKKDSKEDVLDEETKNNFRNYIDNHTPNYARTLQYHPKDKDGNVQAYIEVMVPLSYLGIDKNSAYYKGKSNDEILEELKRDGLDEFIGYRIPTEGKQSTAIMKVVGILDDSYGSTIVVPDEWVAQTGSDFDVDSIYTIQYETKRLRNGKITKIEYKEIVDYRDYFEYARDVIEERRNKDESATKEAIASRIKEALKKEFDILMGVEHKSYTALSEKQQEKIKGYFAAAKETFTDEEYEKNPKDTFRLRLTYVRNKVQKHINKLIEKKKDENAIKRYQNYKETLDQLVDFLEYGKTDAYSEEMKKLARSIADDAKKYGLMTFEEFINPNNIIRANSRKARNSEILHQMIEVLKDDKSLEENLSRSNFDDITYWKNQLMSEYQSNERKARSAYNWADQAAFQEEAMSGAKLKAVSVTMDTFCSVCNVAHAKLSVPFNVIYDSATLPHADEIKKRYGIDPKEKKFVINHQNYGWSADNKNVANKILTAYSSQTTAYILDAIKEGSLPNVNLYTFNVFKLFPNLGCDYRTALSFIMQPAITKINDYNNGNNSIFASKNENPVYATIKEIAEKLGVAVDKTMSIHDVLKAINDTYNEPFNKLFEIEKDKKGVGASISLHNSSIAKYNIIVDKLIDRIKERGIFGSTTPVDERNQNQLLFDLGITLIFNRLRSISGKVSDIARCCNPDKFGAKQTVYATRKVFADINDAIYRGTSTENDEEVDDDESINVNKKQKKPILTVDVDGTDKHILAAIYPGCDDETLSSDDIARKIATTNDIEKSVYSTLYSFLKYASATSVVVAKTVLETEHENFVRFIEDFSHIQSGANPRMTEELYDDLKKYVLGAMYQNISSIKYPVKVTQIDLGRNRKDVKLEVIKDGSANDRKRAIEERRRVYGFDKRPSLEFEKVIETRTEIVDGKERKQNIIGVVKFDVADIKNPTEEELEDFAKLSPAQKVYFIQKNFYDSGIFKYIRPVLYNGANRGLNAGRQLLEFIPDNLGTNAAYAMFKQAYYSTNPLIAATAIDVIKYAVIVEGLKMTQRGVFKIIDNDCFIDDISDGGLGFVKELRGMFNDETSQGVELQDLTSDDVYENYLRSHPETKGIRTIWLNNTNRTKFAISSRSYGMFYMKADNTIENEEERTKEFNERCVSAGIKYKVPNADGKYRFNNYVRINEKNESRIYKIYYNPTIPNAVLLYPLGRLLPFECSTWSSNQDWNKGILSPTGYEIIAERVLQLANENKFDPTNISEIVQNDATAAAEWYQYARTLQSATARDFNMKEIIENPEENSEVADGIRTAYEMIAEHFATNDTKFAFRNSALSRFIFSEGPRYGSTQEIDINGVPTRVRISLLNNRKDFNKRYLDQENALESFKRIEEELAKAPSLQKLAKDALNNKQTLWNVYVAEEEGEAYASSVEEGFSTQMTFAKSQRDMYGDQLSVEFIEKYNSNNVNENVDVIKGKLDYVARENAAYATNMANYITIDLFQKFEKEVTEDELHETFKSIDDPEIIARLSTDDALMNKFVRALNLAKGFIDTFSETDDVEFDSDDPSIKINLQHIREAVNKVKKLPLTKLNHAFAQAMADKVSTNPLIKDQFIDVCDAYWRTEGWDWKFTDIRDNGTPLLQIMLKDIATDLDAKRKHTSKVLKDYWNHINDIKKRAREHGFDIDMNKIINNEGKFNRAYSQAFVDKLDELRNARNAAANEFGFGSIEHLKAKLEYDEFKAKYINQPAQQEYYLKKCELERTMLYGRKVSEEDRDLPFGTVEDTPPMAEIFSKYSKLVYQMIDIYSHQSIDGFTNEDKVALNTIRNKINDLKVDHSAEFDFLSDEERAASLAAAKAITWYMDEIKNLNDAYFETESAFGFEEELYRNLDIVAAAENVDAQGIIQTPQTQLDANEEYQRAKKWLRLNARFEVKIGYNDDGTPSTLGAMLQKALDKLGYRNNGRPNSVNTIMYKWKDKNGDGLFDEKGVADGRKLSDEDKKKIKDAQRDKWNVVAYPPFSDRSLISNALPDDAPALSPAFYLSMAGQKDKHPDYIAAVTEINNILLKYYNNDSKIIRIEDIPITEEGCEDLEKLGELYQRLREITEENKTGEEGPSASAIFIKKNVKFVSNTELFQRQGKAIQDNTRVRSAITDRFREAALNVLFDRDADGNWTADDNGNPKPNRFLYGYAVPKAKKGTPEYNQWIDTERRDAINFVHQAYITSKTNYYEIEKNRVLKETQEIQLREGSAAAREYWQKWYDANHVYNPTTRLVEPIACWTKKELNYNMFSSTNLEGGWLPKGKSAERKVRDGHSIIKTPAGNIDHYDRNKDMTNHDYKERASLLENYHPGSPEWDNNVELNEFEQELSDYLQKVLKETATVDKAQRFFKKGYAPRLAKNQTDATDILKDIGKMFGFGLATNKTDVWRDNVGYENDVVIDPPMSELLKDKRSIEWDDKIKVANQNILDVKLNKKTFATDAEKEKFIEEQEAVIEDAKNHLNEINNSLLNREWDKVVGEYLNQISRYNAVLENKDKIYYLQNMIKNMKMLKRDPITNKFVVDTHKGSKENPVYAKQVDNDLILQYENYIRRLVFDQWKERSKLRVFADQLQGFTSANYMMLNVRGGIANVTLGISGILGEARAKEFFSTKSWAFGTNEWRKGLISYMRRGYNIENGIDRFYSKQDAIIQYFNVVDYDEWTDTIRESNLHERAKKLRNAMFAPQTVGEHFMQNSVLFAMLDSNKIFNVDGRWRFMTKAEYIQHYEEEHLNDILTEEQREEFRNFKDNIKKDPNTIKDYVEFRRNALTEFMYFNCSDEQRKKFIADREEQQKKAIEEFDSKPTMYDQIDINENGELTFVDGTPLDDLSNRPSSNANHISMAEKLCAEFADKCRQVNSMIHGNYNRDAAAYIEKFWYGSIIMQYHKHLPIGILKRYLRRGHWDETRGIPFKGMLTSVHDMLNLNFRKIRAEAGLTTEQVGALEAFTFTLKHLFDYFKQLSATWEIMPEYDKANIRRNFGDAIGVVGAMLTVAALWYIADDDEEMQESIWFNMALYEADRLASEAFMYNPYGLFIEGKKLMSTPVAAQSVISDALNGTVSIINWLLDDEYDPYYHSGRFAGEHKLWIWFQRRIPMYNGIRSILDTPGNNHYYKLGQNPIGLFNVKKMVTGEE